MDILCHHLSPTFQYSSIPAYLITFVQEYMCVCLYGLFCKYANLPKSINLCKFIGCLRVVPSHS